MPPLEKPLFSPASALSFFIRLIGLKPSSIDGLSEIGCGFLVPKKADGVAARDTEAFREGLAALTALGAPPGAVGAGPPGVNVLAAGLGLNSIARTLNRDVALAMVEDWLLAGLVTWDCSLAGPVGGARAS